MIIDPKPKRVQIVNPWRPVETIGSGAVMWSTIDGNYMVWLDDTRLAEEFPSDMVIFDDDLMLMSDTRKAA